MSNESELLFGIVKTNEYLEKVLQLRYKIYSQLYDYSGDHAEEQMEKDDYDKYSINFYCMNKETGKTVGTIRLVKDSELGFPIEELFEEEARPYLNNRTQTVEVSRRITDPPAELAINFGLLRIAFHYSKKNNIKYWIFTGMTKDKKGYVKMGCDIIGKEKFYPPASNYFYPMFIDINCINEPFKTIFEEGKNNMLF